MRHVSLKMLMGDRAKYVSIIFGLTFASLLITQQAGIFLGIMARTFSTMSDLEVADIWVMDPMVQYLDDIYGMQDTQLYRVRGVDGVEWAVPFYKGQLRARLKDGRFQTLIVMGIDDATLIGGPPRMMEGQVADLRRTDAIIVDSIGASTRLTQQEGNGERPLRVGDIVEINDNRAQVVGFCQVTRPFSTMPIVYMTYTRALQYAPQERKMLPFILVKAKEGVDHRELAERIHAITGLGAHTKTDFKRLTVTYYLKNTAIPFNFGTSATLGFLVGTAVAGQTFYNFTLDNLKYFATFKAMGATNRVLLRMILLQAFFVGGTGFGLGAGIASLIGFLLRKGEFAFWLPWQLLLASAAAVSLICLGAAAISIRKVIRLEPGVVFK
ncbi:MAG TPA: ABC transporter permease [Nitrospiraceae bacterium]|nr:ABC transporter permease [Nitrospiraceae bacterium]